MTAEDILNDTSGNPVCMIIARDNSVYFHIHDKNDSDLMVGTHYYDEQETEIIDNQNENSTEKNQRVDDL